MRKIFLTVVLIFWLFANEIVNGDIEIYTTSNPQNLIVNGETRRWLYVRNNESVKFAIVVAGYYDRKSIELKNGNEINIYYVVLGNYKKEKITVDSKKVKPPKNILKRINEEREEANKIYSTTTPNLQFWQKFLLPLNSTITSQFGTARILNEIVKSYHSGTDFRASIGTPILASNTGTVVIAKDRYYAGGSVVIDHGEGIYTQYYHLSKIDVKVGQIVQRGEYFGLSGASGRVNGPHLHFGVIVNGKQVNPLTFIEKINEFLN